eukprot:TRINITY_DN9153_c0_g1_i4.p1 TRINITY_DN9153_c0_g1~~TRINITY_DN9153_c0_g1_i4.p1  ORF type:complete len:878 (-),score=67.18 TRINITY_DN9153_c0_g1_i4:489-3122(-)
MSFGWLSWFILCGVAAAGEFKFCEHPNRVKCYTAAGWELDSPFELQIGRSHTPSNFSEYVTLQCNAWGYCHAPHIRLAERCSGYVTNRDAWSYAEFVDAPALSSPFAWFGVQSRDPVVQYILSSQRPDRVPVPAIVYNGFYACIVLCIATSAFGFLVLCRASWTSLRHRWQWSWRQSVDLFYYAADIWKEFPSLFEKLPSSLHELASRRMLERRTAKVRTLLLVCSVLGPLGVGWTMVQYVVPSHMSKVCEHAGIHSPRYEQLKNLEWQRQICMELFVPLILTWFGLIRALRPSTYDTLRSITTVNIVVHIGMLWHLLEVQRLDHYKSWFNTNYVFLRLGLGATSGRVRVTVLLNICLGICEVLKAFTSFPWQAHSETRFAIVKFTVVTCVAAGFEYLSMMNVIISLVAQNSSNEAKQGRAILDTMCDAVAPLKHLVIDEACPKLAALLLLRPSTEGLQGRPFLDLVVDDEQERVRSRIEQGVKTHEAALLIHTKMQSVVSNKIAVQLCVSGFQDLYGNQCHVVGIREEDMRDEGRIDSLPSSLPLASVPVSTPPQIIGKEGGTNKSVRSFASRSSLSVSSGTSAEKMLDMIVEAPDGAREGTASIWLDCAETGQYCIVKYDRVFASQFGPSLGVLEFTDLLYRQKSVEAFRSFMTLRPVGAKMATYLHLPHWQTGLRLKVVIRKLGTEGSSPVTRLELFNFSYRWRKAEQTGTQYLPEELTRPSSAKPMMTNCHEKDMLELTAEALTLVKRQGTAFQTTDFKTTPDAVITKMVLELLRRWHFATDDAWCCDMHMRLTVLLVLVQCLLEEECGEKLRMSKAWQCETCSRLYDHCPAACSFCRLHLGVAATTTGEAEEDAGEEMAPEDSASEGPLQRL